MRLLKILLNSKLRKNPDKTKSGFGDSGGLAPQRSQTTGTPPLPSWLLSCLKTKQPTHFKLGVCPIFHSGAY